MWYVKTLAHGSRLHVIPMPRRQRAGAIVYLLLVQLFIVAAFVLASNMLHAPVLLLVCTIVVVWLANNPPISMTRPDRLPPILVLGGTFDLAPRLLAMLLGACSMLLAGATDQSGAQVVTRFSNIGLDAYVPFGAVGIGMMGAAGYTYALRAVRAKPAVFDACMCVMFALMALPTGDTLLSQFYPHSREWFPGQAELAGSESHSRWPLFQVRMLGYGCGGLLEYWRSRLGQVV